MKFSTSIRIFKAILKTIGSLIFLSTVNFGVVYAQSIRVISTKDGLPQSFVSGLVQDDSSFVWMGTRNGLARFDGIQYKIFQHNSRDTGSVTSNLIIWIERDRKNQLWIEYESGEIDIMDPATEKIHHFLKGDLSKPGRLPFIRRGWLVDQDQMFWGIKKNGGLICYDKKIKKTTFFTNQNSALSCDTIKGLLEYKNKGIWILNQRGITLFNKKTKQFSHWQIPFRQDYGNFTDVNAVAIDLHQRGNGELIWGDRHSLFFFNPTSHTFRTILLPSISYLGIRWIRTGPDGFDYFETFGKVYRYSDAKGLTLIGKTVTKDPGQVKSFLVDNSGLIWIGTNGSGIQQIDLATPFFRSLPYKKDFSTDVLLRELGINMQQTFNWTLHNNLGSASYNFRSAYDAHKRLYMALENTICYYDIQQKKVTKLPLLPQLIGAITVMPDGTPMVVDFSNTTLTYNFSAKSWTTFVDSALLFKKLGPLSIPLDIIADKKSIWIATTNDGLLKIDIKTKSIVQLKENSKPGSIAANQLLGLRADPKRPDLLWIGSYQGLMCLNKTTLKCGVFGLKDGLPDNTIYSILSDRAGNLWLSTNKGICRFDPVSHHTEVFHVQNGLPDEEFNRFHHLELPDGQLIFGGIGGWTIFNPLLMKNDLFEPAVAITDLKINNKEPDESGKNGILKSSLNSLKQLILPFDENTISVGFAGLEFSQPQDLQYRYRLVNYDNDWISAGNSHQANYTKIPPGNYTLLINSSNNAEKWSSHIKSLKIRIRPPWWGSGMAYFCYVIIVGGLVWMFIRFRVNRALLKREIDIREKEKSQLKELDEMKSRFFSNITHEFRTPLTLILGPAEQLKAAHSNDPQQTKLADTIVCASRQLLVLINHLMDLFKLEARALKLQEQRGSPASLVGAVVKSFENDAEARQIKLLFQKKSSPVYCWFYADALERIVFNLVSNALKFAPQGGEVEVSLSLKDHLLELQVADNGPGIPNDNLPYIFDRFYQAEGGLVFSGGQNTGTGIGLSIVKELVKQMEGDIQVESNTSTPTGTTFMLSMPCRIFEDDQSPDSQMPEQLEQPEGNSEPDAKKRAQILLVEDSEELAAFITGILSYQFEVTHVLNGAVGYDRAVSMMPDLIVSDVMMPVMDGFEFCGHLKKDIRTSHIPVILLTAKVSKENIIEGLTQGADDYLTKPFYPTELLLRIQNLFSRQKQLRAHIGEELSRPGANPVATERIPQDIFITRLYELLDENLDDCMFGVDQLVGLMNLSRSSLHRKIKSLTGMSTTEIVRNYRLKKASLFLLEGYNSSEAAYKAGFGSPAYFTKSFREVFNITPGDFVIQNKSGKYTS